MVLDLPPEIPLNEGNWPKELLLPETLLAVEIPDEIVPLLDNRIRVSIDLVSLLFAELKLLFLDSKLFFQLIQSERELLIVFEENAVFDIVQVLVYSLGGNRLRYRRLGNRTKSVLGRLRFFLFLRLFGISEAERALARGII